MYRSQCCAHNNGTRGVVETTFWVPLSRAQHVLPYLLYAWAIQKGRKTDVLHVQNWKTRSLQRALTVSLSKSNSVYEKAAEGVIPAKCMLVRGYSSKGGGQETRFFASSERKRTRSSRSALAAAVCVTIWVELRLRKGRRGRHSRKAYATPRIYSTVHSKIVLYVEYSTGGAFDSPTQNTISKSNVLSYGKTFSPLFFC